MRVIDVMLILCLDSKSCSKIH